MHDKSTFRLGFDQTLDFWVVHAWERGRPPSMAYGGRRSDAGSEMGRKGRGEDGEHGP